jgi:very-short-patch-repair endonuclease
MEDVALHRLAGRQHWLVTRAQLTDLGYGTKQIRTRLASGVLFGVHRDVYGVAGARRDFEFNVMAACLAAGDGAVASHRCAAALFGLRRIEPGPVEVTVVGRRAPQIHGVQCHRSDLYEPSDRGRIKRIPVTATPRTLLDLAGCVPREILEGALDDVLARHLATLGAIERLLRRSGVDHRRGAPGLQELVQARRKGLRPTETVLEDELLALMRRSGLPEPVRQYEIELAGGKKARFDGAYPHIHLALEADGDEYHAGLLDRQRDGARDAKCQAQGWMVRRFSTDDIRSRPAEVAIEIARLLGLAETG